MLYNSDMEGNRESRFSPESVLNKVVITEVPVTHEDDRRAITEYFNRKEGEPSFSNQKIMRINKSKSPEGLTLGNHYHEDWELFFLADGEIDKLVLRDINSLEQWEQHNLGPGTKILLPPNVAHLLVFKEPSLLIASNEYPFDVNNLIPYNLKPNEETAKY